MSWAEFLRSAIPRFPLPLEKIGLAAGRKRVPPCGIARFMRPG